jgi:hypothetical protein
MFKSTVVEARIENSLAKAEYHPLSGRLHICAEGSIAQDFFAPDSWVMIASCSAESQWGTCPSKIDLIHVLRQFAERMRGT